MNVGCSGVGSVHWVLDRGSIVLEIENLAAGMVVIGINELRRYRQLR